MPLAVLPEAAEHEVVALLRQELGPVADHRSPVAGVAQAKLTALFDEPEIRSNRVPDQRRECQSYRN